MYLSIRHTFTRQGVQKHHHFPLYMHATPLSTLNNTSSTHCLLFIKLKKLTQLPSVKPVTYMSDKKIILISQEANILQFSSFHLGHYIYEYYDSTFFRDSYAFCSIFLFFFPTRCSALVASYMISTCLSPKFRFFTFKIHYWLQKAGNSFRYKLLEVREILIHKYKRKPSEHVKKYIYHFLVQN